MEDKSIRAFDIFIYFFKDVLIRKKNQHLKNNKEYKITIMVNALLTLQIVQIDFYVEHNFVEIRHNDLSPPYKMYLYQFI